MVFLLCLKVSTVVQLSWKGCCSRSPGKMSCSPKGANPVISVTWRLTWLLMSGSGCPGAPRPASQSSSCVDRPPSLREAQGLGSTPESLLASECQVRSLYQRGSLGTLCDSVLLGSFNQPSGRKRGQQSHGDSTSSVTAARHIAGLKGVIRHCLSLPRDQSVWQDLPTRGRPATVHAHPVTARMPCYPDDVGSITFICMGAILIPVVITMLSPYACYGTAGA